MTATSTHQTNDLRMVRVGDQVTVMRGEAGKVGYMHAVYEVVQDRPIFHPGEIRLSDLKNTLADGATIERVTRPVAPLDTHRGAVAFTDKGPAVRIFKHDERFWLVVSSDGSSRTVDVDYLQAPVAAVLVPRDPLDWVMELDGNSAGRERVLDAVSELRTAIDHAHDRAGLPRPWDRGEGE